MPLSVNNKNNNKTIVVGITGASGLQYAFRLIEHLAQLQQCIHVIMSKAAYMVANLETDWQLPRPPKQLQNYLLEKYAADEKQIRVFEHQDWRAPVASGSGNIDAMVICPCTTGTVAAVANGHCDNLIDRGAEVMLKEKKPLLLVPRETPLSIVTLENLLRAARAGATIISANPGFYHRPQSVDDLIDFIVARILDHLQLPQELMVPWGDDCNS